MIVTVYNLSCATAQWHWRGQVQRSRSKWRWCACVPGAPGYPAAGPGTVDYLAAAGVAQYPPGYPAAALAMAAAAATGQSPATTGLLDQPSSSSTAGHCEYSPPRTRTKTTAGTKN